MRNLQDSKVRRSGKTRFKKASQINADIIQMKNEHLNFGYGNRMERNTMDSRGIRISPGCGEEEEEKEIQHDFFCS